MKRWRNRSLFVRPFTFTILLLGLIACGTSEPSKNTSSVSLTIQTTPSKKALSNSFSPTPSGITDLEIIVLEGDLVLISEHIPVASGEPAVWTKEVPNGKNRVFSVTASGNGNVCSGQSEPVTLTGQKVTIEINMQEGCSLSEPPFTLVIIVAGGGSGSITSEPVGISCGEDCSEQFNGGEAVVLSATPGAGSFFVGLSGHSDCADASVTMNSDITCTATFELVIVSAVAAGEDHSCARITDGTLQCWGDNGSGSLGNGTRDDSLTPIPVADITNATDLSAGKEHTCAIVNAKIQCWGYNGSGQLGDGTKDESTTPLTVLGISKGTVVSPGEKHTCAIVDGTVQCWGDNRFGQLGDGTHDDSVIPVTVSGITNATDVSSGGNHTCAIVDGTAKCWGDNRFGQLGDGTQDDSSIPVAVLEMSGATQISAGADHNCARLSDGTVKCWGSNKIGQLGQGTYDDIFPEPRLVSGLGNTLKVSLGQEHSCALLSVGTLNCWGGNHYGQVGDGTGDFLEVLLPVPVSGGIATATDIASGWFHSCASLADGTVKCWGDNLLGQLGDGTTNGTDIPVTVMGLP